MTNGENELKNLSEAMSKAVTTAGTALVTVHARRRFPASGIGFAPDLILTADHVVERDEDIVVVLPDGEEIAATVAGRDPANDLAVLRLAEAKATVAEIAPEEARVGQLVLALGRPGYDGVQASLGIVSAMGEATRFGRGGSLEQYIRTDAIPYPGFSGGALIDVQGRVTGMNTSGLGRGVSLAIPINLAWQIAEALAEHGSVRHGYLGIRTQPVELSTEAQGELGREQASGLLVVGVESDSPAAGGGVIVGDILVSLAGQPLRDPDELAARLRGPVVGQPTEIEVLRGGKVHIVTVTVGEREAQPASHRGRGHRHGHGHRRGRGWGGPRPGRGLHRSGHWRAWHGCWEKGQ